MHALPPDVDFQFLVGRRVLQMCIGSNEVILNCDGEVSITIEGSFVVSSNGDAVLCHDAGQAAQPALRLIGAVVDAAEGAVDGTLRVTFTDGLVLSLIDSGAPAYESFHLSNGMVSVVV